MTPGKRGEFDCLMGRALKSQKEQSLPWKVWTIITSLILVKNVYLAGPFDTNQSAEQYGYMIYLLESILEANSLVTSEEGQPFPQKWYR